MSALIAAEFCRLRTVRGPWLFLAVQVAGISAGITGFAVSGGDVHASTAVRQLLSHGGLVALLTLILGVNAVAGEYRHKTITDVYLATPRRSPVIIAKLVAYTAVGTAFGLVCAAVSLGMTAIVLAGKDASLDLGSPDVWRTLAGVVAWNAVYAAIGVSLGALVTNLFAAVTVALVWIALVEGIVSQLLGDLSRWLPGASGRALDYMPVGDLLPQWAAGLVLVAYAILFAVVATMTAVRRDIT